MPATSRLVATVLQMGPGAGPAVDPVGNPLVNLAGSAVTAFFTTLVVGAILVTVAPDYTEGKSSGIA